jgi:hypothetical protein
MTPEELQPLVARLNLPGGQLGVLNRFWSHSEPVKFAGGTALESEMSADLEQIGRFVEVTTAAQAPPEPLAVAGEGPPAPVRKGG